MSAVNLNLHLLKIYQVTMNIIRIIIHYLNSTSSWWCRYGVQWYVQIPERTLWYVQQWSLTFFLLLHDNSCWSHEQAPCSYEVKGEPRLWLQVPATHCHTTGTISGGCYHYSREKTAWAYLRVIIRLLKYCTRIKELTIIAPLIFCEFLKNNYYYGYHYHNVQCHVYSP